MVYCRFPLQDLAFRGAGDDPGPTRCGSCMRYDRTSWY